MKNNLTKHTRTSRTGKIVAALAGLALLAAGSPAFAGRGDVGNFKVMPLQSHSDGLGSAEWAERFLFWQFMHSPVPFATIPTWAIAPVRADHSMPEMIHLVNLILQYQGTSSAFSIDALGRVQLTIPNDFDVAALNAVRTRWDAEESLVPGRNFDQAFWEFKEKLQAVAAPAFTLNSYNYFAVPFLPSEAASMERLQFFIKYSQHTSVPPMKCTPAFMAAQGLPWVNGTMCCFVDPSWAGADTLSMVSPKIFGGVTGATDWASTTAVPVLTDPDSTTVSFTIYRASGVVTNMTLGDTGAFPITLGGVSEGTWFGYVSGGTVATGSKATYTLVYRL